MEDGDGKEITYKIRVIGDLTIIILHILDIGKNVLVVHGVLLMLVVKIPFVNNRGLQPLELP
jgi:hypothetical protein